jgi:hypothetical protein
LRSSWSCWNGFVNRSWHPKVTWMATTRLSNHTQCRSWRRLLPISQCHNEQCRYTHRNHTDIAILFLSPKIKPCKRHFQTTRLLQPNTWSRSSIYDANSSTSTGLDDIYVHFHCGRRCRDGHVCPSWIVTHFILWTWRFLTSMTKTHGLGCSTGLGLFQSPVACLSPLVACQGYECHPWIEDINEIGTKWSCKYQAKQRIARL